MNRFRRLQMVPMDLIDRSQQFAARLIAHYAAGGSPRSRSRSGDRGTESNLERQTQGKIGECAAALLFGLDPIRAVKWGLYADGGTDLETRSGISVDVKTTIPPYRLIWSNNVNDLYADKQFDVLVAVSIDPNDFRRCWIEGYVTKTDFLNRKRIATGSNGLEPGTWFMEKVELANIEELIHPTLPDLRVLFDQHGASPIAWMEWDRRHDIWYSMQRSRRGSEPRPRQEA